MLENVALVSGVLIAAAIAAGTTLAWWDNRRTAADAGPDSWTDPADTEPVNWRAWTDQHTGQQPRCSCRGRRCANRGLHCPGQQLSLRTTTLGVGDGVHEPLAVLRRIVPPGWSPLPPALRAFLAPSVHTPIVHGARAVVPA